MGAGTYTGIEAVSNGLPILREPRVRTGRRTMVYMGTSLAITVAGLLIAYLLYSVAPVDPGKTLNAVLCEKRVTASHWPVLSFPGDNCEKGSLPPARRRLRFHNTGF